VTDRLLTLIRIFRRVEVRCGGTGAGLRDLAEKNSLGKNRERNTPKLGG